MKLTKKQKKWITRIGWVLFAVYIAVLAYFLFFSEALNRVGGSFEYNLTPLKEIKRAIWCYMNGRKDYFYLNAVMNVVAFMPFGFILPVVSPKNRKFVNIAALGFELTLLIEILQLLLRVGCFDVDDLILNTLGAISGYILFAISHRIGKRR